MTFTEKQGDLFDVPEEYFLAHCISADFGMGAGIVVEFNRRFDMKRVLKAKYPNYLSEWTANSMKCGCIPEGRVFNLITKKLVFHKPTYDSLKGSLELMRDLCAEKGITKLAMPRIGCGIDGLKWERVSAIIREVFADTDIEILVCVL